MWAYIGLIGKIIEKLLHAGRSIYCPTRCMHAKERLFFAMIHIVGKECVS